ncbi:MAG: iron hydrogenase small subunit [Candidatus Omnitrophica bacterium]|nr:iron hydrogenase small subunit [Candidatus Omnitrophota bacterium]
MKKLVSLFIDGKRIEVEENTTILEAAKRINIDIPHLCYDENLSIWGGCRVCVVEVEGRKDLVASCSTFVEDKMVIRTNTKRVKEAREVILELLLTRCQEDCRFCQKSEKCKLKELAYKLGIKKIRFEKRKERYPKEVNISFIRDPKRCILCGKCIRVCHQIQAVGVIDFVFRGEKTKVSTFFNKRLDNLECTSCGQCILVCPTGALSEKEEVDFVWEAIFNPKKFVIVEVAPAVRVSLGEEFDLGGGTLVTKKLPSVLRRLGFDRVFDTQFAADLTIVEEASELIERIKKGKRLPLITSCSPAWVKYLEHFFPHLRDYLSTCKSPQQMFGAIAKTYYAQKIKIHPKNIIVVSVMPCVAKKFEARRKEMVSSFLWWKNKLNLKEEDKFFDVDFVLTTRELAKMVKERGIDFVNLEEEEFDSPLGISTGAAVIFGVTGGVMEAALRTAYEVVTGKTLEKLEFEIVRGMRGIKKAEINLNGMNLKVAVAHGLSWAKVLLEEVKEGKSPYHFIEVMACPGGCLGGGGQPIPTNLEIRKKRAQSLYKEDKNKPIRKSHQNPAIIALYKEFLKSPLSKKAHMLLHTSYVERGRY